MSIRIAEQGQRVEPELEAKIINYVTKILRGESG